MKAIRPGVAVALLAGVVAFAPGRASAQAKRDVITREEIEKSPKRSEDIFTLIRSLRPHFLEPPRGVRTTRIEGAVGGSGGPMPRVGSGGATIVPTAVYMDGNFAGELNVLASILAEQVGEVRYFEPGKAQAEFGMSRSGGVVAITTYKGPKP